MENSRPKTAESNYRVLISKTSRAHCPQHTKAKCETTATFDRIFPLKIVLILFHSLFFLCNTSSAIKMVILLIKLTYNPMLSILCHFCCRRFHVFILTKRINIDIRKNKRKMETFSHNSACQMTTFLFSIQLKFS